MLPDRENVEGAALPAGRSVTVLVRVKNREQFFFGRFLFALDEWQVDGMTGAPSVSEWWPLPHAGSGMLVC